MASATLLLPARAAFTGVALPAFVATALGRADRIDGAPGRRAQLQRHFDLLPRAWPAAALTRAVDAADAPIAQWLRADPAWIRPDINGARLFASGEGLHLDRADADALLPTLRPLFGDAGMPIDAPHPSRWYLRIAPGMPLPVFPEPDEALGADLGDALVDDALSGAMAGGATGARRWRVLLSEAQVVLHNHPWNARRAAEGKPPVNSLWLWGGGALPDHVATKLDHVASGDALLQGLSDRAGVAAGPMPPGFHPPAGNALLDLRDSYGAGDIAALRTRWLQPAVQALRGRELRTLSLDFADGIVLELATQQRWRVWARPLRSLA
jgi:hypothetical protein